MWQRLWSVLDWFAPVIMAIGAFRTAYLGVHVSFHPPGAAKQRRYKYEFITWGVAVIGLTLYQFYRNQSSQSALLSDVGSIKVGVSSIDTQLKQIGPSRSAGGFLQLVQFNASEDEPQFVVGKPFVMNIAFGNKGTEPVYHAVQFSSIVFASGPGSTMAAGRAAKEWFASQLAHQQWSPGVEVGVGIAMWQTAATGTLDRAQIDQIRTGQLQVCLLGYARWRDKTGSERDVQSCFVLQKPLVIPAKRDDLIWQYCQ